MSYLNRRDDGDYGESQPVDLLHVVGEHGVYFDSVHGGLAGRGEHLRLELDFSERSLASVLDEIQTQLVGLRHECSATPVAFVSVPFRSTSPVIAQVPEVTVRRSGSGDEFVHYAENPDLDFAPPMQFDVPHVFDVRPSRSPKEWCEAVEEAVLRIGRGELDKVVLAREILVDADADFSQYDILRHLRRSYPSAYRYAIDGFVGASPELLIERTGTAIRAEPMAGTVGRSSDVAADVALRDGLLASAKNLAEHKYLVDMITETLAPFCSELNWPESPSVVSLTNVHHLATAMTGTLPSPTSVLQLVAALHPTPAVGGRPTNKALDLIDELEELDRGRYAGAVGWVDANGDGRFAVAIRCAQLAGSRAHVYAGNGIVAASIPSRELEETEVKLQAMLSAIVRP